MALQTYIIKAKDEQGNIIWSGSCPKNDNYGQPIGLNRKLIDRGIREAIGYSGKYKLEVK